MNSYPDTFTGLQLHYGDSYQITWTGQRWALYGCTGTPDAYFDAVVNRSGAYTSDAQQIAYYKTAYNARVVVATDINISMTAVETDTNVYEVVSTVSMDADGSAKALVSHIVKAIDYYPAATDGRYRNCVRGHREVDVTLNPGESYQHVEVFTLNATDISHLSDLVFVAFVERDNAAHEVWNSEYINYPFPSPNIVGDVDGDGDVDLSDLAELLAAYGLCDGDVGYNDAADFEDNDCIDLADLAALLGNYGYSG